MITERKVKGTKYRRGEFFEKDEGRERKEDAINKSVGKKNKNEGEMDKKITGRIWGENKKEIKTEEIKAINVTKISYHRRTDRKIIK